MTIRVDAELRSVSLDGNTLHGVAHVYGGRALVNGRYEQMQPGAFTKALKSSDPVAMFNHDPNFLLGRVSAGTLRIEDSDKELRFAIDLPDTQGGRDVRTLVERGDLKGASFGFMPGKMQFSRAADGREVRMHTEVSQFLDVSPVALPAFTGTSLELRSMQGESLRSQLVRARARVARRISGQR